MILIPAGEFLMGSNPRVDPNASDREQPQHLVYLPDYYLAKTPVTNAQFLAFVKATGYQTSAELEGWGWVYTGEVKQIEGADWQHPCGPQSDIAGKYDHPVVQVSWHDAVAYCHWLAEITGKPYRLPSEAEWEKGARGTDGRIYPWGNEWDTKRCNSRESGLGDTTPVGAYPAGASPYGLLDMAGNVWEWTRSLWGKDWHKPSFKYPYRPGDGRENLKAGDDAVPVLRGGSWYYDLDYTRCANRGRHSPGRRNLNFGFRVVVSPFSS
jgi:formylglycine-generating enzyme required for sulfatase activity